MAVTDYGETAECGPTLTKPVFPYGEDLTFPPSAMSWRILEMQSNCWNRSVDGHTDFALRMFAGNLILQKRILDPSFYSSLDNLKWAFSSNRQ